MKYRKIVFGLVFMGLIVLSSCKRVAEDDKQSDNTKLTSVKSIPVQEVQYRDTIHSSGVLTYDKESKLSFKTGGIIDHIAVHEGQYVKMGELLASVKQDEIEASVLQAQSAFEKAQRDYERVAGLFKDSVATLEQLQNAKTQLTSSEANLKAITFNRKHSYIVAPSSGVIQKVLMDENELAAAGSPVLIFGSANGGKVFTTYVPDINVVRLQTGEKVDLKFDARANIVFNGVVQEIAGMANEKTGTYEVKVSVIDNENLLLPGFIGSANFVSSNVDLCFRIPIEALVNADKNIGLVYVVSKDNVKKQSIVIRRISGSHLIVSSGLKPQDNVIYEGQDNVSFVEGQ